MEDEIGRERLLEGRREALHELGGKPPDEADRVGHEVSAAVVREGSRRRIECLEQPVVDGDVRLGERVQEGRLADVRVAGKGDGRRVRAPARRALRPALRLERPELPPEEADPAPGKPAVALELRLPGAARSDPAAEALEMLPHASHARKVVLELRELDLELALGASSVLSEDVEDQLGPVHDPELERILEPSLLARVELVVDDHATPPPPHAFAP